MSTVDELYWGLAIKTACHWEYIVLNNFPRALKTLKDVVITLVIWNTDKIKSSKIETET